MNEFQQKIKKRKNEQLKLEKELFDDFVKKFEHQKQDYLLQKKYENTISSNHEKLSKLEIIDNKNIEEEILKIEKNKKK